MMIPWCNKELPRSPSLTSDSCKNWKRAVLLRSLVCLLRSGPLLSFPIIKKLKKRNSSCFHSNPSNRYSASSTNFLYQRIMTTLLYQFGSQIRKCAINKTTTINYSRQFAFVLQISGDYHVMLLEKIMNVPFGLRGLCLS